MVAFRSSILDPLSSVRDRSYHKYTRRQRCHNPRFGVS